MSASDLTIIGATEKVVFPDYANSPVLAKVDTGADSCSVSASHIVCDDAGNLSFTLFTPDSPHFTGERITVPAGTYRTVKVHSSFGEVERRYAPELRVQVAGRIIKSSFTLTNRGHKTYPILIGRRLLRGIFLVDVSEGKIVPIRKSDV